MFQLDMLQKGALRSVSTSTLGDWTRKVSAYFVGSPPVAFLFPFLFFLIAKKSTFSYYSLSLSTYLSLLMIMSWFVSTQFYLISLK